MPVNPAVDQPQNVYTALDLCTDAMIEVGMASPGDPPDGDTVQWVFRKANYLLDVWAAKRQFVFSRNFQVFNLVAGLSPHTIGPSNATFAASQRPVKIESWALVLNQSPTAVDLPHKPTRDKDWWAMQRVKSLASSIPTDLYYEPTFPNGSCFFWPVPDTVYPVRLELWGLLSQFLSINDPVDGPGGTGDLPPAYRAAVMLSLAEHIQPGASKQRNPLLSTMAADARAAVWGNNSASPRSGTADFGMSPSKRRADFNWETGNLT